MYEWPAYEAGTRIMSCGVTESDGPVEERSGQLGGREAGLDEVVVDHGVLAQVGQRLPPVRQQARQARLTHLPQDQQEGWGDCQLI